MGRAKRSALFAAHPVLRKAINSSDKVIPTYIQKVLVINNPHRLIFLVLFRQLKIQAVSIYLTW